MRPLPHRALQIITLSAALVLFGCSNREANAPAPAPQPDAEPARAGDSIRKIRHVIVIMQENRSFDSYFGTFPGAADEDCPPIPQNSKTPGIWNPLPYFDTVREDGELGNIQTITNFYRDAAAVAPPRVDQNGYGLRVPALVISPYARRGYIDHQTLSFDAYVKFIEDDFLGGQRLDPRTDGRPDPRPTVRENVTIMGDLRSDFDFAQTPRAALILPEKPATTLIPPGRAPRAGNPS